MVLNFDYYSYNYKINYKIFKNKFKICIENLKMCAILVRVS